VSFPKTCKVCSAVVADQKAWVALPFVGQSRQDWGEVQELRNCACGNTLSVVLERGETQDPHPGQRWQSKTNAKSRIYVMEVGTGGVAFKYSARKTRYFLSFADFYKTFTPVRRTS